MGQYGSNFGQFGSRIMQIYCLTPDEVVRKILQLLILAIAV